jgi:hypothetical protein
MGIIGEYWDKLTNNGSKREAERERARKQDERDAAFLDRFKATKDVPDAPPAVQHGNKINAPANGAGNLYLSDKDRLSVKSTITNSWNEYLASAGTDNAKDHAKLHEIKQQMTLLANGNPERPDLYPAESYAQAGLDKDRFLSALNNAAVNVAKANYAASKLAKGSTEGFEALAGVEDVLKDTVYFQKGGLSFAVSQVLNSDIGFNETKKVVAERAALDYASLLKNGAKNGEAVDIYVVGDKLRAALVASGQNPDDDRVMQRYVGVNASEFQRRVYDNFDNDVNTVIRRAR